MTPTELIAGLQALSDLNVALSAQLRNVPANEAVAGDALAIAGLVDPTIVPFEILLPLAEWLIVWLIANNKLHQQRMLPNNPRGSNPNLTPFDE